MTPSELRAMLAEAAETPWHWVNPETDEPREPGEYRSSLRTVAHFGEAKTEPRDGKHYTSFSLPKFILDAEDLEDAHAALIVAAVNSLAALLDRCEAAERDARRYVGMRATYCAEQSVTPAEFDASVDEHIMTDQAAIATLEGK